MQVVWFYNNIDVILKHNYLLYYILFYVIMLFLLARGSILKYSHLFLLKSNTFTIEQNCMYWQFNSYKLLLIIIFKYIRSFTQRHNVHNL